MIISAIPSVIQAGKAIGPFALSLYMLAVGAAMFKPNIAPWVHFFFVRLCWEKYLAKHNF
jgi:hypothetical protein